MIPAIKDSSKLKTSWTKYYTVQMIEIMAKNGWLVRCE